MARLTLERYIRVKGVKADASKRSLSYNIVNVIGDNNLNALKRPNKGKKYNNNIFKDKNYRFKRLAFLSKYPNK